MKREFNNPELIKDAEKLGIKITLNSSTPGVFANVNGERFKVNIADLFTESDDDLCYREDFHLDEIDQIPVAPESNQHKLNINSNKKIFSKNQLIEAA